MRRPHPSRQVRCHRSGQVLAWFALMLPLLLGMVGLVIDTGMLMATHRQTQNAADAAALAAAFALMRGNPVATALATANGIVQNAPSASPPGNGLANATSLVLGQNFFNGPSKGPYQGNIQYVEVLITNPSPTWFIQVLGINRNQSVTARAVAGYEMVTAGEGCIVLDPTAIPGLKVQSATLYVSGRIIINSQGAGNDENGNPVNLGYATYAASANNNGLVQAADVDVVGGVDWPQNFQPLPGNTASPLHCRQLIEPDPLLYLPTPSTSTGMTTTTNLGSPAIKNGSVNGLVAPNHQDSTTGTVYLNPGIYSSIDIESGTVTFNPGIYVLTGGATNTLKITGNGTSVTGNGVMFYNTGSDYNPATGAPDSSDGNTLGTDSSASFGAITINAQTVNLQPFSDTQLSNADSKYNGMLFYQRRWNTQSASIQGNAGAGFNLGGTIYGKWAQFKLAGSGQYNAQFVVGSMTVTGNNANVTVNYAGKQLGKAPQVFLVE